MSDTTLTKGTDLTLQAARVIMAAVLDLIYVDPHQWSTVPDLPRNIGASRFSIWMRSSRIMISAAILEFDDLRKLSGLGERAQLATVERWAKRVGIKYNYDGVGGI